MANKKTKGGKGKGPKPGKRPTSSINQKDEAPKDGGLQLSPQDKVNAVKPFWETLSQERRVALLTIEVKALRERAKQLTEKARAQAVEEAGDLLDDAAYGLEPTLEDLLEEGIRRLKEKGTWKLWQSSPDAPEFYDAESFREFMQEKHIKEELRNLLPKEDGKPMEKAAEASLRQRMSELLQKIQQSNRQIQEDTYGRVYRGRGHRATQEQINNAVRDSNIEMITTILEALEHEHEFLYHSMLFPVTSFLCEMLPEEMRESTKTELYFEDLEKLPAEEVARVCEWLTEKVDALSAKLKPGPKDEDEEEDDENMGDVDLWALTEDGESLTVNTKWLQHLQERLLGDDGHPRKVHHGEDPHRMGLVLEWVYGSIVSTAEKARDGAKRTLGARPPSAAAACETLIRSLEEQHSWEMRAKQAKELLADMLRSRREAAELAKQYDMRPIPRLTGALVSAEPPGADDAAALPDEVIVAMLKREVLLTRAKLHALVFEHIQDEKALRSLKAQLRQGEPEFDRLKHQLEEVKHAPRGLEGTFRTAAEMERHRHQMADEAIEQQLEVQTAFREQGQRLQSIYDRRQRKELDMARREQEIKQLQGWKATVENLIERFDELIMQKAILEDIEDAKLVGTSPPLPPPSLTAGEQTEEASVAAAAVPAPGSEDITSIAAGNTASTAAALAVLSPCRSALMAASQHVALTKLRTHFAKDVRKQLYSEEDDKQFFNRIKNELKVVEKKMEDGAASLQHLEMHLINVACDDPGAAIGAQLALPLLQERLDQMAMESASERARAAEDEIIRMELERQEREAAEREKKAQKKMKKQDKYKNEKERERAEREAKELAEKERELELSRRRAEQEEEGRRKRVEELAQLRKAEEALMEQRRLELLADPEGYWRQRMADEQQQRAALAPPDSEGEQDSEVDKSRTGSSVAGEDPGAKQDEDDFVPAVHPERRRPNHDRSHGHHSHSRSGGRLRREVSVDGTGQAMANGFAKGPIERSHGAPSGMDHHGERRARRTWRDNARPRASSGGNSAGPPGPRHDRDHRDQSESGKDLRERDRERMWDGGGGGVPRPRTGGGGPPGVGPRGSKEGPRGPTAVATSGLPHATSNGDVVEAGMSQRAVVEDPQERSSGPPAAPSTPVALSEAKPGNVRDVSDVVVSIVQQDRIPDRLDRAGMTTVPAEIGEAVEESPDAGRKVAVPADAREAIAVPADINEAAAAKLLAYGRGVPSQSTSEPAADPRFLPGPVGAPRPMDHAGGAEASSTGQLDASAVVVAHPAQLSSASSTSALTQFAAPAPHTPPPQHKLSCSTSEDMAGNTLSTTTQGAPTTGPPSAMAAAAEPSGAEPTGLPHSQGSGFGPGSVPVVAFRESASSGPNVVDASGTAVHVVRQAHGRVGMPMTMVASGTRPPHMLQEMNAAPSAPSLMGMPFAHPGTHPGSQLLRGPPNLQLPPGPGVPSGFMAHPGAGVAPPLGAKINLGVGAPPPPPPVSVTHDVAKPTLMVPMVPSGPMHPQQYGVGVSVMGQGPQALNDVSHSPRPVQGQTQGQGDKGHMRGPGDSVPGQQQYPSYPAGAPLQAPPAPPARTPKSPLSPSKQPPTLAPSQQILVAGALPGVPGQGILPPGIMVQGMQYPGHLMYNGPHGHMPQGTQLMPPMQMGEQATSAAGPPGAIQQPLGVPHPTGPPPHSACPPGMMQQPHQQPQLPMQVPNQSLTVFSPHGHPPPPQQPFMAQGPAQGLPSPSAAIPLGSSCPVPSVGAAGPHTAVQMPVPVHQRVPGMPPPGQQVILPMPTQYGQYPAVPAMGVMPNGTPLPHPMGVYVYPNTSGVMHATPQLMHMMQGSVPHMGHMVQGMQMPPVAQPPPPPKATAAGASPSAVGICTSGSSGGTSPAPSATSGPVQRSPASTASPSPPAVKSTPLRVSAQPFYPTNMRGSAGESASNALQGTSRAALQAGSVPLASAQEDSAPPTSSFTDVSAGQAGAGSKRGSQPRDGAAAGIGFGPSPSAAAPPNTSCQGPKVSVAQGAAGLRPAVVPNSPDTPLQPMSMDNSDVATTDSSQAGEAIGATPCSSSASDEPCSSQPTEEVCRSDTLNQSGASTAVTLGRGDWARTSSSGASARGTTSALPRPPSADVGQNRVPSAREAVADTSSAASCSSGSSGVWSGGAASRPRPEPSRSSSGEARVLPLPIPVPVSEIASQAGPRGDLSQVGSSREESSAASGSGAAASAPAAPKPRSWSAIAARDVQQPGAPTVSSGVGLGQDTSPGGGGGGEVSPASVGPPPQGSWRAGAEGLKLKLQQGVAGSSSGSSHGTPIKPAAGQGGAAGGQQQAHMPRVGSNPRLNPLGPSADVTPRADGGAPRSLRSSSRQGSGSIGKSGSDERLPFGRLWVSPSGAVVFDHPSEGRRVLRLVRGLQNLDGQYNCFLNVIIQSLWHLRSFREALLRHSSTPSTGAAAADAQVMLALRGIFSALARVPEDSASVLAAAVAAASAPAEPTANGTSHRAAGSSPRAASKSGSAGTGTGTSAMLSTAVAPMAAAAAGSGLWIVSPNELRTALSALDKGQAAISIEMSEMHDASEVLGEILNSLHRAELGQAEGDATKDVQLPQRVRLPRQAGLIGQAPAPGAPLTMAAVVNGTLSAGPAPGCMPRSMAHSLFGMDVQVPAPSEDEDGEEGHGLGRGGEKRGPKARAKGPGPQPLQGAAKGKSSTGSKDRDVGGPAVLQFMKYCHLVPAQGLRQAHDTLFDSEFEEVLAEAEAADSLQQRLRLQNGAGAIGAGPRAGGIHRTTMLRQPVVFTLAVVWESPQAPLDAIKGTVAALGPVLDLGTAFGCPGARGPHRLRSVICYFGHHYQSFALSEELDQWLQFDDSNIRLVGSWRQVCRTMVSARMQPSLLFYETA